MDEDIAADNALTYQQAACEGLKVGPKVGSLRSMVSHVSEIDVHEPEGCNMLACKPVACQLPTVDDGLLAPFIRNFTWT